MEGHRHSRMVGSEQRLRVSFEFFPPKIEQMEETLWRSIERLAPLSPAFVSVTYGAGGSTRERTHGTVKRILAETSLRPAAHLTCVGASLAEVDAVVDGYVDLGVRHIVALRGDPLAGLGTPYIPHAEGYHRDGSLPRAGCTAYPDRRADRRAAPRYGERRDRRSRRPPHRLRQGWRRRR